MIYFDHASTTYTDKRVLDKMLPYFTEIFGNADSSHAAGRAAMKGVDEARDKIASLVGVKPKEIYFTAGGSEADSWAIKSCVESYKDKGRHIVVSAVEHHSVLSCAKQLENDGYEVTYIPVDEFGAVDLNKLSSSVREDTVLVAVMHANNEVGTIEDVKSVSEITHRRGAKFLCDCVQTAGRIPFPVEFADMISMSAHKFYGPKGVGALYIKSGTKISSLINGGEQERGKRGGTTNVAGVVGMAEALALCKTEERETARVRDYFESRIIKEIKDVKINGDVNNRLPGISNITFYGRKGESLLFSLDLNGVACSMGSACMAGSIEASHVLTAMGVSEKDALSSLRFSFGRDNTVDEVDKAVEILKKLT